MAFSKIDKKVLIISVIIIVIILLLGFAVYRYTTGSRIKVQDTAGGAKTEQNMQTVAAPSAQAQVQGVQVQGTNVGGKLSVCQDKCGDGICQKTDSNCGKGNNLNCICPETPQECPQDCK